MRVKLRDLSNHATGRASSPPFEPVCLQNRHTSTTQFTLRRLRFQVLVPPVCQTAICESYVAASAVTHYTTSQMSTPSCSSRPCFLHSCSNIFVLQVPDQLGWISAHKAEGWHILCDHSSCCYRRPLSDTDPRADDGTAAHPYIIADGDWAGEFWPLRASSLMAVEQVVDCRNAG